jgi:hypothetical protein
MIDAKSVIDGLENPATHEKFVVIVSKMGMSDFNEVLSLSKTLKGLGWLNKMLSPADIKLDEPSKIIIPKTIKPKAQKIPPPVRISEPPEKLTPLQTLRKLITNSTQIDRDKVLKWIDRLEAGESIRTS